MSRRPLEPLEGEHDRRAGRMAPGGKLRSEAPINPVWVRSTGSLGDSDIYVAPSPPSTWWDSPTSTWVDGTLDWMGL